MIKITKKLVVLTGLAFSLVSCNGDGQKDGINKDTIKIMGAGSSFIYPPMSRWANSYYEETKVQVNYQPIGSGGGQRQIFQRMVDFAASDQPLKNDILEKHNLLQFPMIIGAIVLVINIKEIESNELVLSGEVLADIYLGKITKWNDKRIQELNKNLKLPSRNIITVHRSDGSGTTYNFVNYLSKVSNEWKNKVGVNSTVDWPSLGIGGKGNAGISAQVKQIPYSIGYVEYAYAKQNKMKTTKLINKDKNIVSPNIESFISSAEYATWDAKKNYYLILTNQSGENSWPIDATTFILLPKDNSKEKNREVLKFLNWSYSKKGDKIAENLDYITIPESVVSNIQGYLKDNLNLDEQ